MADPTPRGFNEPFEPHTITRDQLDTGLRGMPIHRPRYVPEHQPPRHRAR